MQWGAPERVGFWPLCCGLQHAAQRVWPGVGRSCGEHGKVAPPRQQGLQGWLGRAHSRRRALDAYSAGVIPIRCLNITINAEALA